MYEELDIPEYLKISQEDRKQAWSNRVAFQAKMVARTIDPKPVELEQVEPVDLTVEIKALAVSAHLNYLIWLKQQVEINLPSGALKPVVQSVGKQDGRGHHYAGKVWVLNRKSGERARIEPSEFSAYEARGFIKAGPRSK